MMDLATFNISLQLILLAANVVIIITYCAFAYYCYKAYKNSQKLITQRVFFYLALVFVLCSFNGYFMHLMNWAVNFNLYITNIAEKNTLVLLIDTGLHIALSTASVLLVRSSGMALLINSINHMKQDYINHLIRRGNG